MHLPWTSCGEHAKGRESMRERWKRLNPIEEYDEREQWDKQWEERKQYEGKDQYEKKAMGTIVKLQGGH